MLAEIFPIMVFVGVYFVSRDIFLATIWLMAATALYLAINWFFFRRLDKIYFFTFCLLLIFGAATLIFREPRFIQWKPTIATWLMAFFFYASLYIGKKPLIERLLESKFDLPAHAWRRLTEMWTGFFLLSGAANLFVALTYDESTWVSFKLYGGLTLTLLFVILQGIYISRFMRSA